MLELKGISKKGKEKIKAYGSTWTIVKEDKVVFAPGIHILLESTKDQNRRWIKKAGDINFEIVSNTENEGA